MIGFLIPLVIRLVVSYMLMRAIYSCYLSLKGNFVKKDQLKSVEATKFKPPQYFTDDVNGSLQHYTLTVYEYHVNGKSYKTTIRNSGNFSPDYKITLYYRSNPKNVFERPQSMPAEEREKKIMLIIAASYAILMTLFVQLLKMIAGLS